MPLTPPKLPRRWHKFLLQNLPYLTGLVYVTLAVIGSFNGGMWGGCGIGLSILLYLGTAWIEHRWPQPAPDFFRLTIAALALMAFLNLLSPSPSLSWFYWFKLTSIFVPLMLLSSSGLSKRAYPKALFNWLFLAGVTGAFGLGTELFFNAPVWHMTHDEDIALTHYNRGLSHLVLLSLPILASLWTRPLLSREPFFKKRNHPDQIPLPLALRHDRPWKILNPRNFNFQNLVDKILPFLLFVIIMLIPTSLTESRASKLAFVAALMTVAAAKIAPKLVHWGLKALLIALLGWPLVATQGFHVFYNKLHSLPESWRARVEIWDYFSYRLAEHPWLGWGLGTSKLLDYQNPHGNLYTVLAHNAPHPHNVVLQLWVELGLPGLALGIAFAYLTLRHASRLSPPLVPFAFGAWVAALCLSLIAYDFWSDSLFGAFALTGFAFALLDYRQQRFISRNL